MKLLPLSLLAGVVTAAPQKIFEAPLFPASDPSSCPIDIPFTCTNSTPIENSCCFESPGGVFVATQFWDYYPAIGDNDSWTLHGLWPDNCDGSWEEFCDDSLNVDSRIKPILVDQFKDPELYEKMARSWKNFNGDDESLWTHEFNKHGTCVRTIRPKCYYNFKQHQNIYDYYKIAVSTYEKLPTYDFFAQEGIVPSDTETYSKKQIDDALTKHFGYPVYFKCNKFNALQEVWYFHHLKGSIKGEEFSRISRLNEPRCPESGIKLYPKGWKPPTVPHPPNPPTGGDRGFIKLPNHPGCLISNGHWYQYGTCATYQLVKSTFGGINLKTSKGFCGFDSLGQFACGPNYSPSKFQFQFNKDTKEIGYGGKYDWCYNPEGKHGTGKFQQIPVKLKDSSEDCQETFRLKFT